MNLKITVIIYKIKKKFLVRSVNLRRNVKEENLKKTKQIMMNNQV